MSSGNLQNISNYRQSYQSIADRIGIAIGCDPNVNAQIARALGVSPQSVGDFKKSGGFPPGLLLDFCYTYEISADWLIFGKGKMTEDEMDWNFKIEQIRKNAPKNVRTEVLGTIDDAFREYGALKSSSKKDTA